MTASLAGSVSMDALSAEMAELIDIHHCFAVRLSAAIKHLS